MDKEDVVYTYNGISLSHKKRNLVVCETWVFLEGIMLSGINQTEKDKHHMTSLICEI